MCCFPPFRDKPHKGLASSTCRQANAHTAILTCCFCMPAHQQHIMATRHLLLKPPQQPVPQQNQAALPSRNPLLQAPPAHHSPSLPCLTPASARQKQAQHPRLAPLCATLEQPARKPPASAQAATATHSPAPGCPSFLPHLRASLHYSSNKAIARVYKPATACSCPHQLRNNQLSSNHASPLLHVLSNSNHTQPASLCLLHAKPTAHSTNKRSSFPANSRFSTQPRTHNQPLPCTPCIISHTKHHPPYKLPLYCTRLNRGKQNPFVAPIPCSLCHSRAPLVHASPFCHTTWLPRTNLPPQPLGSHIIIETPCNDEGSPLVSIHVKAQANTPLAMSFEKVHVRSDVCLMRINL